MIKKLRNQPYAPKWGQAQKWEQEEEKNTPSWRCAKLLKLRDNFTLLYLYLTHNVILLVHTLTFI
jgi:hypothetical protein